MRCSNSTSQGCGSGTLNLRNACHVDDLLPLDLNCRCPACRQFSRAYLHDAAKASEIIASMLLTWHNLTFYQDLMVRLRAAITRGALAAYADAFAARTRTAAAGADSL